MSYTTQMDAARKGIFTEEMQRVCEYENIDGSCGKRTGGNSCQ